MFHTEDKISSVWKIPHKCKGGDAKSNRCIALMKFALFRGGHLPLSAIVPKGNENFALEHTYTVTSDFTNSKKFFIDKENLDRTPNQDEARLAQRFHEIDFQRVPLMTLWEMLVQSWFAIKSYETIGYELDDESERDLGQQLDDYLVEKINEENSRLYKVFFGHGKSDEIEP